MHIKNGILSVGHHELELDGLEGIQTVQPPYGRQPFTVAFHHDGFRTLLREPLPAIDDLFCEAAPHLKRGWTPVYDRWGARTLLNLTKLSTRPSRKGVLGSMYNGQTEFTNTVHPEIYAVGMEIQHGIFLSCVATAALQGHGWNTYLAAPLVPRFSPANAPEHPVRLRKRSALITQEAA